MITIINCLEPFHINGRDTGCFDNSSHTTTHPYILVTSILYYIFRHIHFRTKWKDH